MMRTTTIPTKARSVAPDEPAAVTPVEPRLRPILVATCVAALGGFLFGYDTAVIAGAIGFLRQHFQLNDWQVGWAAGSAIVGCIPGAMFAGFLADRFGRKRVLMLCALLYAISAVWSGLPRNLMEFVIARMIGGLAVGASSMVCPVYISEISPERYRGRLGCLFQLAVVCGMLFVAFSNLYVQRLGDEAWNVAYGWRWMLASEVLPALVFFGLLFLVHESPRWLAVTGRTDRARRALDQLIGPAAAERELAAIARVTHRDESRLAELFHRRIRRPLVIGLGLAILSQFCGINAVMYYAPEIFKTAGWTVDSAFASTVWISATLVVFTVVAMLLIDRAGRKPLLIIGGAVQTVALVATSEMFRRGYNDTGLLVSILVFIAAFAVSMGPIAWIIISEIFPGRIRGRAASAAVFVMWTSVYVVSQTFPPLAARIGPAVTFFAYACFAFAGLLFTVLLIPETKGKTLEEIEASWGS